ncbi:hypothetical protein [Mesorhizobium sp. J8]|uniref:hypothetical protein n=1 Tax=Mesorhizobium sp. J8 TaxID=2777475 RepID=UPI001916C511|nr:hypothetical protein [Mesorhizobium sp. J8]BCM19234.1 hypothetical protein MJ8_30070 [Mesorhizobium sp. J8]
MSERLAIFGRPEGICPRKLFRLPLPMQAEGVRLLFEMGQSMAQVKARLGLSGQQVRGLLSAEGKFTRGGEGIGQNE